MPSAYDQQEIHRDEFRALGAHIARIGRAPKNVDVERSHLNRTLYGDTRAYLRRLPTHQPTTGRKIRSDAVLGVAIVCTLPKELHDPHTDPKERYQPNTVHADNLDAFLKTTLRWAQEDVPGRLVCAELHMDEKTPHVHILVSPEDERGHVSHKKHFPLGIKARLSAVYAKRLLPLGVRPRKKGSPEHEAALKARYRATRGMDGIATLKALRSIKQKEHEVYEHKQNLDAWAGSLTQREKDWTADEEKRKERKDKLQQEEERLNATLPGLRNTKSTLTGEVDGLRTTKASLTTEVGTLQREADGLAGQVESAERTIEDAKGLPERIERVAEREAELNGWEGRLTTQSAQQDERERKAKEEAEKVLAKAQAEADRIEALAEWKRHQWDEGQAERTAAMDAATKAKQERQDAEKAREQAEKERDEALSTVRETQGRISTLQQSEATAQRQLDGLKGPEGELTKAQAMIKRANELSPQVAALQRQETSLTAQVKTLTAKRDGLASQVESAESTIAEAKGLPERIERVAERESGVDERERKATADASANAKLAAKLDARDKLWETAQEAPATKALYDKLNQVPVLEKLPLLTGRKEWMQTVNRYIKQEWEGLKAPMETWERAIVAEARALAKKEDHQEVREELAGLKEQAKEAEKQWSAKLEKTGTVLAQTAETGHRLQQRILEQLPEAEHLQMAQKLIQECGVQSGPAQEIVRNEWYRQRQERDQGWER